MHRHFYFGLIVGTVVGWKVIPMIAAKKKSA